MKISVITPTIRLKGLDIVRKSLSAQTFKDFEWLICSKEDPKIEEAIWVPDTFTGGFWSLNRAYNALFKRAKGELIVTWQDWIFAKPDALEKFWEQYEATNKLALIGTSGHQYESINKYGKPQIKIWSDPRRNEKNGSFYEIYPQDFEWNFGAIPLKAIFDVGGFCEILDEKGFGMDGYQVNERLDLLGYKFFIDHSNESYTIRHGREDFGGEDNWNKNNNLSNGEYEKVRQESIRKNEWPRMKYLSIDK